MLTPFSVYLDTYWHGLRFLRALILLNLGDVLVYLRVINTSSSIRLTKLATIVTCTVSLMISFRPMGVMGPSGPKGLTG